MYRSQEVGKGPPLTNASGLSDAQFDAWTQLLEQVVGVVISPDRKSFLVNRLKRRMRALRIESFDEYFACIKAQESGRNEWAQLVDEITVHETEFFRNKPANDYLETVYLPQRLIQKHEDGFHAWSLGCASGEEAYTLAMLIDAQSRMQTQDANFGVTATDINAEALNRARRGRYGCNQFRQIPERYRKSNCTVLDTERFEISSALRRRVCFVEINMLDLERFPLDGVDLISCQNILMYFARPQRLRMLSILAERLASGGLLVLGTSDIPRWSHPDMTRVRWQGMLAYLRNDVISEEAKEQA